ncbi:MAG: ATP-binding protein, partial [Thermodesulfobacteriota bacterium]
MEMKLNLAGKLRNTKLARSKALLPLFEAIVNSFHSIEEIQGRGKIIIRATRCKSLEGILTPAIESFEIIDNGIGFTQDNYDSFITSDSLYKIKKGGKGLGRFLWLKAFQEVHLTCFFAASNDSGMPMLKRTFSFDPTSAVKGGIEEPIEG